MSVPNQKIVTVSKEPCDEINIYVKMNVDAIDQALMNLKQGSVLKVWMYFAKNQNGYTFELSSKHVMAYCNITDKTYREAIKTLIEKRYLVPRADNSNLYDFYEIPVKITVPKDGTTIVCHTSTEIVSGKTDGKTVKTT